MILCLFDLLINRLLGKVDELELTKEHISIPYIVGENIKVVDGPFNGYGSIENVNEEKRKLQVMVKIFGRKTPLELSYMQVEKFNLNQMAKELTKF